MLKKLLSYVTIFAVAALALTAGISFADNEQEQLQDVKQQASDTKAQINAGKKKLSELDNQIKALESQISKTEQEIAGLQTEIAATEQQIVVVSENLAQVEAEMAEQNDELQQRLRAMYKNDDGALLQILLGSENITDFMTNMDMVQRIFDNDVDILKKMEEQHKIIEEQKQELENLQAGLETQKQQQADKKAGLQASKTQIAALKQQIEADNAALSQQLDRLNAEAERITEEIRKLQSARAYAGGSLLWPSDSSTRVTSEYGNRIHPILRVQKLHTGMDIGAAEGTNVLAANDGTVIKAAWNNSYGNVVLIDHGGSIVTLYAHNSKLLVKTGDTVKMGQVIALVGSTGDATGPHIHFEVRVNGVCVDPRGYL